MLKITNLQKTFNPGTVNAKTALSGLNLTLEDGDFVTVIGGNGAFSLAEHSAVVDLVVGGVHDPGLAEHQVAEGMHKSD